MLYSNSLLVANPIKIIIFEVVVSDLNFDHMELNGFRLYSKIAVSLL